MLEYKNGSSKLWEYHSILLFIIYNLKIKLLKHDVCKMFRGLNVTVLIISAKMSLTS